MIKALISDADGTLIDTLHLIRRGQFEAAHMYLAKHGISESDLPSYDTYEAYLHQAIGGSARETLEATVRLLFAHKSHHLNDIDFDELHDLLDPTQDKIASDTVKQFKGLSEFLRFLGTKNIKLAIFSSGTPHHLVRNFGIALPELGLTKLFQDKTLSDVAKLRMLEDKIHKQFNISQVTFVTCEDVSVSKPDPESLLLALDRLDVRKEDVAVLGDHWVDMAAGVNAGVAMRIGITHGFDDVASLKEAGATIVADDFRETENALS